MSVQEEPTPALNEVFSRAVVDDEFLDQIFDDRDAVIAEYELSDVDLEYLDSVPRDKFESTAAELRAGSVSGNAAPAIGIGIGGHFGIAGHEED